MNQEKTIKDEMSNMLQSEAETSDQLPRNYVSAHYNSSGDWKLGADYDFYQANEEILVIYTSGKPR